MTTTKWRQQGFHRTSHHWYCVSSLSFLALGTYIPDGENNNNNNNNNIKNFDERPHRRGGFFTGINAMWHRPFGTREHCSRLQQWRCHAVVDDWMITFVAYNTEAETSNVFQWVGKPPKLPIPVWDLDAHVK